MTSSPESSTTPSGPRCRLCGNSLIQPPASTRAAFQSMEHYWGCWTRSCSGFNVWYQLDLLAYELELQFGEQP